MEEEVRGEGGDEGSSVVESLGDDEGEGLGEGRGDRGRPLGEGARLVYRAEEEISSVVDCKTWRAGKRKEGREDDAKPESQLCLL